MSDRLYTIFNVGVRSPSWPECSWGGHTMFRESRSVSDVVAEARVKLYAPRVQVGEREWRNEEPRVLHDAHVSVTIVGKFSWALSWFSHWTFDTFADDAEALDSFERHVWRVERINREKGLYFEHEGRRWPSDYWCLMGAEDRYRWTARAAGTSMIGTGQATSNPPCRCDACRSLGIVRIDH